MRIELKDECDYTREARAINTFRGKLISPLDANRYRVPWVCESSTKEVLILERLCGTSLGENSIRNADQSIRNEVRVSEH